MLSSGESLAQKFVNKWFWLYLFTFFIWPLGYLVKVLITRDLSVEEVGMLYGTLSFVMLLSTYSDFGCTDSLAYFLPRHIVKKEYGKVKYLIQIVFFFQIITSIVIYSILFFIAPWLSLHYFKADISDLLHIAWLFFIGINLLHIATAFFTSVQDTKLQKWTELVRIWATATGTCILFFWDFGSLEKYLIVWIGWLIMGILFSMIYMAKKYYLPYFWSIPIVKDTSLRRAFFSYSLATLFTANITMVLSQIDMQLIIYFLWARDVGFYSTYLSLIGIPFFILTPIIGFIFPVISELSWRWEESKIQELVLRFWKYFGIIGIWTWVFLFQFSESLSIFFFGERFRESWEILAFSAPFIIFNFLVQISFQVLAGTGHIRKRAEILGIVLIINTILNIILIPLLGTKWAALAVSLSWIPLYYMGAKATKLSLPIFGDKEWYKNLGVALFTYVIIFFTLKSGGFTIISINLILAILVYMIIFILTNLAMIQDMILTVQNVRRKTGKIPSPDISLPL